jgi:hypothetical protein
MPTKLGTYRYVPMGTPLFRSRDSGFNVTYDEVWKMYETDTYDLIDEEKGFKEWKILLEDSPWYVKILLIIALLSILLLIATVLYTIKKRYS